MLKKLFVLSAFLAGAGWALLSPDQHPGPTTVHSTQPAKSALASPRPPERSAAPKALAAPAAVSPEQAVSAAPIPVSAPAPEPLSPAVTKQIAELQRAKKQRNPVEKKMASAFIYAQGPEADPISSRMLRGLQKDAENRVLVDVTAEITPALLKGMEELGASVLNHFAEYHAMRAWVPPDSIQTLAGRDEVSFVQPAVKAQVHAGSVVTQGDTAHSAGAVRSEYGISGAGVKVGVLSDNLQYLANSQAAGELGQVTTLTGQAGSGQGEGTAMLEIIHDIAPSASLYFATAMNGPAAFAKNIQNLANAGCTVIVDDVGYYDESPFQDGVVAQAVNSVTAKGVLYFSAAGNSGSKASGRSSTWEGNFVAGSTTSDGTVHNFGSLSYNAVQYTTYDNYAALFWSDALGHSGNDYDLYVLDSSGQTVVAASDDYQGGTQNPYEMVPSVSSGERLVVVLSSGSPRYLHLETGGAPLALSTSGSTRGHNCATNAFCVAAIDAGAGKTFAGNGANPEEVFSSDGPRRMFYAANGTAYTPGNFLASGGVVRKKPDVAAADGVRTSVPQFSPFYGTSAAAPHAAALAALFKSAKSSLTQAEIRNAMTTGTIDNDATGWDVNSGYGIVMAPLAMNVILPPMPTNPPVDTNIVVTPTNSTPATNIVIVPTNSIPDPTNIVVTTTNTLPEATNIVGTVTNTPASGAGTTGDAILSVKLLPEGALEFTIAGTAGQTYTIQSSTNLSSWTDSLDVRNTDATTTWRMPAEAADRVRFYRATASPPAPVN